MGDIFTLIIHNFFSFIVIISVIVFIHEFGHYWVARRCGVRIESFSIGFGPEVYGWNDAHGTRWKISAFPLGGYVKMFGDVGAASTPDNQKLKKLSKSELKMAFHTKPLWAKSLIVVAGPAANFILAIIIISGFFMFLGRPETTPEIGQVVAGSAAEAAGLKVGDIITSIDGSTINRFEQIRGIASLKPEIPLQVSYLRGTEEMSVTITPKLSETTDIFGNKIKVGLIGIASGTVVYNQMGPGEAIFASFGETYDICAKTLLAVGQMITGQRSTDDLSGILRIAQFSGQSTDKGLATVFWFMAILSINLGLINLFPIPMLDGGHLLYYTVEGISGRPLAEKVQEAGFKFGFVLLILLMVFATYNDLKHFGIF